MWWHPEVEMGSMPQFGESGDPRKLGDLVVLRSIGEYGEHRKVEGSCFGPKEPKIARW